MRLQRMTRPPTPYAPSVPAFIVYRGRVRKVWGYEWDKKHVHYILRFKRGHTPPDAPTAAFGARGQAHVTAVLVRSDHCKPLWGMA